jgi:hypothetical protein
MHSEQKLFSVSATPVGGFRQAARSILEEGMSERVEYFLTYSARLDAARSRAHLREFAG